MHAQVLGSGGGDRHERAVSRRTMAPDEAPVVRVLPHGKARTRRPPRLEHLNVRTRLTAQPLEQIENQAVDAVGSGHVGHFRQTPVIGAVFRCDSADVDARGDLRGPRVGAEATVEARAARLPDWISNGKRSTRTQQEFRIRLGCGRLGRVRSRRPLRTTKRSDSSARMTPASPCDRGRQPGRCRRSPGSSRAGAHPLLDRIWALRDNLSRYDATYVALAELLDCSLLTSDARLGRASGSAARSRSSRAGSPAIAVLGAACLGTRRECARRRPPAACLQY
jgi:hypothetical protein